MGIIYVLTCKYSIFLAIHTTHPPYLALLPTFAQFYITTITFFFTKPISIHKSTYNSIKINTHAKYPYIKYFGERAAEEITGVTFTADLILVSGKFAMKIQLFKKIAIVPPQK